MKPVKKAILPVAGLGTRFLPATKAIPKEMLPIIDKPLVQYAVEEAIDIGVTEIIFITSHTKRSIEDHFNQNYELDNTNWVHCSYTYHICLFTSGNSNNSYKEHKFYFIGYVYRHGYWCRIMACIWGCIE